MLTRIYLYTQIEDYVVSCTHDAPLLLLGGSGSGKTTVMAKATQHILGKAQKGDLGR
jgi:flagellar biosynthesis GTPase FlhF